MPPIELNLKDCGVTGAELRRHAPRLRMALRRLDESPEGEFLRVTRRKDLLQEIQACVRERPSSATDVVQLGIGGSSLGAQALCAALLPALHNQRVQKPGMRFHFPDNVDPESFTALLETLDPARTLVHVVSKSGETLETLAQLHTLLRGWKPSRALIRKNFVVTTGASGALRDFVDAHGTRVLSAPADVAGRFSVFTASGLLVPALCGVPVARVLAGARALEERCRDDALAGPAGRLAGVYHNHDRKGRPIHVEMIYADALVPLGAWFCQIWAESLGKGGQGPSPVVARGTTDQHSQLQLYVDGPDDKLYTIVRVGRLRKDARISARAEPAFIRGRKMSELLDAEARGTIEALLARGRPVVQLLLPSVTPDAVGELLMLQQLQTALAGALYDVYPFDQPGVEAGKLAAERILKRR